MVIEVCGDLLCANNRFGLVVPFGIMALAVKYIYFWYEEQEKAKFVHSFE